MSSSSLRNQGIDEQDMRQFIMEQMQALMLKDTKKDKGKTIVQDEQELSEN